MNIYSNSFFHRVSNPEVIKLILCEGFKVFYCKEDVYRGQYESPTCIGIPMVCFCDLPLVHIAHNNYGKCGIAMSRKWGRERHLEPVLYYPNDVSCQSTKMIIKAADNFINTPKDADSYRILGYAKPVKKPCSQSGKSSDNYVEREWRKVYANPAPLKWFNEAEYNTYRGDKNTPKRPVGNPLHFGVDDIDFILIDKSHAKELQQYILNDLRTIGNEIKNVTQDERYMLLSKLLIFEDLLHNL